MLHQIDEIKSQQGDIESSMKDLSMLAKAIGDGVHKTLNNSTQTQMASVKINAGGAAVWVAVTACITTTVVVSLFAVWAIIQINRLEDYRTLHDKQISALQKQDNKQ